MPKACLGLVQARAKNKTARTAWQPSHGHEVSCFTCRRRWMWKEVILSGNPRQRIPCGTELRRQLQRGTILFCGVAAIALFLKELAQQVPGLEGGCIFRSRVAGQVATQHL